MPDKPKLTLIVAEAQAEGKKEWKIRFEANDDRKAWFDVEDPPVDWQAQAIIQALGSRTPKVLGVVEWNDKSGKLVCKYLILRAGS